MAAHSLGHWRDDMFSKISRRLLRGVAHSGFSGAGGCGDGIAPAKVDCRFWWGQGVTVRSHPGLTSPVSFGLFRPMILLPGEHRGWSQAELSMVLRHELAHIRRWDSAFLWLAEICRAVFWMNPLVWLAVKQMRSADERAADDLVLQGGDDANTYAGFLLELARKTVADVAVPAPTSAISAMAQPSTIRMRVERILDESQARRQPGVVAVLVTVMTAATLAVLIGGGNDCIRPGSGWQTDGRGEQQC